MPAEDPVVIRERQRRLSIWAELCKKWGISGLKPRVLNDLRVYRGGHGVYVDKNNTSAASLDSTGITVGILHTGSSYRDDLAEDCILYHYPHLSGPSATGIPVGRWMIQIHFAATLSA